MDERFRSLQDREGRRWNIDWDSALRVIRSFHRSEALLQASRIVPTREGAFLPTVHTVVVDWARVQQLTNQDSTLDYRRWSALVVKSPDAGFQELQDMRSRTAAYNALFRELQTEAQRRTTASIDAAVEFDGRAVAVFKGIRDVSSGVLLAGATIMSGGWAAAAMATGSALDGAGKYQDLRLEQRVDFSTAVGSAILQVTSDVIFSFLPGKLTGASSAEKVVVKLVIAKLKVGTAIAQSLLEGETFKQASVRALTERGVDLVLEGIPLAKWAIPARIGLRHGGGIGRVVSVHRVGDAVVGVGKAKVAGTAASLMGRLVEPSTKAPPAPLTTLPADGQCNADAALCEAGFLSQALVCLPR